MRYLKQQWNYLDKNTVVCPYINLLKKIIRGFMDFCPGVKREGHCPVTSTYPMVCTMYGPKLLASGSMHYFCQARKTSY